MKKKSLIVVFIFALSLVFSGGVFAQSKSAPAADAAAVWAFIKKAEYAKKWKMWPGSEALHKGEEPHGAFVTTYVNPPAFNAINKKRGKMPYGSVVVIENYTKNKKLKTIDVMYKVKGYNPQGGNWFWTQYKVKGTALAEGMIDECIKCHEAQKKNDYVWSSKLK
jgi:hypothetical protein